MGCLDRSAANGCGALLVISTSIPLVQTLLLLSEVIDWSLAAFSPVYFHSSSLFSRILPFLVGVGFSSIIMAALIVIDSTADKSLCVSSPTETAVISAYDISLVLASICLITLAVLLKKNFRSSFFKPIAFGSLFLGDKVFKHISVPLYGYVFPPGNSSDFINCFKYAGQSNIVTITDITNILVAIHSLVHSAYFVYNHEDIRQGCRATFLHFHILSSVHSRS
uniref:Sulfate_transp domain-containing protein n=1 Tax=Heterorhabditis bacteriophora TaxID=37862 RepID=A0A1I7XQU5_HETBA